MRRPGLSATMAGVIAVVCTIALARAAGATDILMGRVDPRGTGANLSEATLTTATVNPTRFGKLFSYEVDGFVYAQPLVVSGLPIRGAVRNVLYVATTTGMVYALDADRPGIEGGLLWSVRLARGGASAAPPTLQSARTVRGNVGILSTPVIDRGRRALYVVSRTLGPSGYQQRLHALDLVTGQDRPSSPAHIAASVSQDNLTFTFDPELQHNRPGLVMSGSSVVIAWNGPEGDHGWVMAYDADTLQRTGVFCTTCAKADAITCECPTCTGPRAPSLLGGGIWQAGRPPVVDASGHVYYFVGNGWILGHLDDRSACCPGQRKPAGYHGQSLVKLAPPTLQLKSSWTPTSWCELDKCEFDLGGSGPILIDFRFSGGETRTFAVGGGKEGRLYTIDTIDVRTVTAPGMVDGPSTMNARAEFLVAGVPSSCAPRGDTHHLMSGPVFWPRSTDGRPSVFVTVENDRVRGYALTSRSTPSGSMTPLVDPIPRTVTSTIVSGHPGAILALSADRDVPGTGILWMTYAMDNHARLGATFDTRRGRVAAYDADDLSRELWNSDMAPVGRDTLGHLAKFTPPSIANGKVYVPAFPAPEPYRPTGSEDRHTAHGRNILGHVVVYGLDPPPKAPVRSFSADVIPAVISPLLAR